MTRTADLVIVGMTAAASAAAGEAAHGGRRVLVVDRTTSKFHRRQFRQSLPGGLRERVSVLTGVEVVCVDGGERVEVVLVRHIRTGRLIGINASAVLLTTSLPALGNLERHR